MLVSSAPSCSVTFPFSTRAAPLPSTSCCPFLNPRCVHALAAALSSRPRPGEGAEEGEEEDPWHRAGRQGAWWRRDSPWGLTVDAPYRTRPEPGAARRSTRSAENAAALVHTAPSPGGVAATHGGVWGSGGVWLPPTGRVGVRLPLPVGCGGLGGGSGCHRQGVCGVWGGSGCHRRGVWGVWGGGSGCH